MMKDFLKNVAIGAVGGAVGTAAMGQYWKAATALASEDPRSWTQEGPPHALDEIGVAGQHHEEGESSTAALGRMAYEGITGKKQSRAQHARMSYAVHWTYGMMMGGAYGAARGCKGVPDAAGGLFFGTALWLLGDELMVSLQGLAKGPTAFPLGQHAHRLGAHLAYGLAAAATTQGLHALFSRQHSAVGFQPSRFKR